MANEQRGEIALTLGDKDYTLRPTYEAIANIEARLRTSILVLAGRAARVEYSMTEAVVIVDEAIRAAGFDVPKDIGELIRKTGVVKLAKPLIKFLNNAIAGDEKAPADQGEENAVPASK